MGWSVYSVPRDLLLRVINEADPSVVSELENTVTCGAIYGKGTAIDSMTKISEDVLDMIETVKPHLFIVENYQYIPGKVRGSTAVPSLIMLLRYHWFKCTDYDAHLPYTQTWKGAILRTQCAVKLEIRDYVKSVFPNLSASLEAGFSEVKHQGEQDSFDAVAIGLYGVILAAQVLIENEEHSDEDTFCK